MAQRWLHCGCSEAVPLKLQSEVSGRGRRVDLSETPQLGSVVVALHTLQCIHQGVEISSSQLTILLPSHGAGVGSQRRMFENRYR